MFYVVDLLETKFRLVCSQSNIHTRPILNGVYEGTLQKIYLVWYAAYMGTSTQSLTYSYYKLLSYLCKALQNQKEGLRSMGRNYELTNFVSVLMLV